LLNVMSTAAENTLCGDAGGWTALPVWETGARLGKARITSLAIFRLSSFRCSLFQLLAASQLFEIT
jgi:hypothetical protein